MTAKFMKTPAGDMPIRKHVIQAMSKMTERLGQADLLILNILRSCAIEGFLAQVCLK